MFDLSKNFKIVIRIIGSVLLLIAPTPISIIFGWSPAVVSIISIILVIVLASGGLEFIKFCGLNIQFQKKLDEAEEILKKLRQMAEINGEAIINVLAKTQLSFVYNLNFYYVEELIENTKNLAKELKIDEKKIRDMSDLWEKIYIYKYIYKLIPCKTLSGKAKEELENITNIRNINAILNFFYGFSNNSN